MSHFCSSLYTSSSPSLSSNDNSSPSPDPSFFYGILGNDGNGNSIVNGSSGEDENLTFDGWPKPDDYVKTFSQLKPQMCYMTHNYQHVHNSTNLVDIWPNSFSNSFSSTYPTTSGNNFSQFLYVQDINKINVETDQLSTLANTNTTDAEFDDSLSVYPSIQSQPQQRSTTTNHKHVNYYPSFDPKEYFCDTVAVDNASMVAQIVGKKGSKIKHLVSKYGIRIRTPNMDQEPVFVIKGKRSDVYSVKQEIQSAASHFMRIEEMKQDKLKAVMNNQSKCVFWPFSFFFCFVVMCYFIFIFGQNYRFIRIEALHS